MVLRGLAVTVALAGCDQLFQLTRLPDAGQVALDDASAPACLRDDFDDNQLDSAAWELAKPTNVPVVVAEQDAELLITLAPDAVAYNGIASRGRYDATGGALRVELVERPSESPMTEAALSMIVDRDTYFVILVTASSLLLRRRTNGQDLDKYLSFSMTTHRHWQLRHDPAENQMVFETSPDRITWTEGLATDSIAPVTSVQVLLDAGSYGSEVANPGRARFDNIALVTPGCP